ncbi:MAG: RluA family pseudouridine synthase [Prevotellaceae bacterium]|jgi:23S rRNA pseudouridine1911/1915/1917 synthase|nr:RluA family pseudouridine synthase [Prevotellaceae bacterium]
MAKKNRQTTLLVKHDDELPHYIMEATGKSRTAVKSLLAHKQVFVDGKNVSQYNAAVRANQVITINSTGTLNSKHMLNNLRIVFEDDDILVVEKPAGLLSISTGNGNEMTAYSILRNYVKIKSQANKIFIVHRLDRETSGLMLFARNERTKETLQSNWNDMVQQRKYAAVVCGALPNDADTLTSYLKENAAMRMYVSKTADHAQRAVLSYRVLKRNSRFSLIEVELETGRKNQIRVQMQEIGHSVAGDKKYGGGASPIGRLALHAQSLEFIHPTTREKMCFSTKIPAKFAAVFD